MSSISQSSIDSNPHALFEYLEQNPAAKREDITSQFGSLERLNTDNETLGALALKCSKTTAANWLLFDYIKNNLTANREEVEAKFGSLDRLNSNQETLIRVALNCSDIAAANWLQQVGAPIVPSAGLRLSSSGLKRSESLNGNSEEYNAKSIEFMSLDEQGMHQFAEANRRILPKLRLENIPLLKYLVKSGKWLGAHILKTHGVPVDEATLKMATEWLYEDLQCKDEKLVQEKEKNFARKLRFYPGDLTQRVDIKGQSELFFMLVLRQKNERMLSALLDLAQVNSLDVGFHLSSAEESEATELAKEYPKSLADKVRKIIKGRVLLRMDRQQQQDYLAEFGAGALYKDGKPLLSELVRIGPLSLAELLIKHGARVTSSVVSDFQGGSLKTNEKFARNFMQNSLAQTLMYTSLNTDDVQGFVKHMALYCGDMNASVKLDTENVPFLLLVLRKRNPMMLNAFLKRAKDLNQKIEIVSKMPEVEKLLTSFSDELQAEAAYAMGTILLSLPCLLIVLRRNIPAQIGEFITRSQESEQKIKIYENTTEMREYKKLLQQLPSTLQERVEKRVEKISEDVASDLTDTIQGAFAEFQNWPDTKRINCLKTVGLDRLQVWVTATSKFKTLLGEMISREYWKAAQFLVEYGARVDDQVLEEYQKVKERKPDFRTNVLDSAVANSKLVKTLGKIKKEETILYINIFQGDFRAEVTIDKISAPLFRHLLRLKDAEITRCLKERMRILKQEVPSVGTASTSEVQDSPPMSRLRAVSSSEDS